MRDLNSLYSEILVMNSIRERRQQACQWDLITEATADRPTLRQRLANLFRAVRVARPTSSTKPAVVPCTERGAAS